LDTAINVKLRDCYFRRQFFNLLSTTKLSETLSVYADNNPENGRLNNGYALR